MRDLLERLRAAWENLSPRERLAVGAVGAAFGGALIWATVLSPIAGASDSARMRTEDLDRQLQVMVRLRREYDQVQGRLATVERQIRTGGDERGLRTLISGLAGRSAVKIDAMEERSTSGGGPYRETKMEVSLKGVTLTQTVNYLHNIEAEERLLSVKSLRIKNAKGRGDGPELLDVSFTVSAFEPS